MIKRTNGAFGGLFLALAIFASGCSDVGDSSAVPGADATVEDDGGPQTEDDSATPVDGTAVTPADGNGGDETGPTTGDSSVVVEASADGGVEDGAAMADAGGEADASEVDAGMDANGVPDAATSPDASDPVDAGVDAGPGADAGIDSGVTPVDSGIDAGATLVACTSAAQTGCVQCQFNDGEDGTLPNTNKVCTPTEAALVQHDIAAGIAVTAGPDPDASCYACAAATGCLDDSEFNDEGHECGDLSGSGPAACLDTIACILRTACGKTELSACYCGTAPLSGTCASVGASNAANGACKTSEAAGLGFSANDGLDILKNFTSTTLAAGVANNIFQCAVSNGCSACVD